MRTPQGVIFDYGNTLIAPKPGVHSTRTDYADVVARPGAERLRDHLVRTGLLVSVDESGRADFVERFLAIRESNRARAEETGREIPADVSLAETLRVLGLSPQSPAAAAKALEEFFQPEIETIAPLPGARETLDRLRNRGIRTAILSNATSGAYVTRAVAAMGWAGYFDPLIVSADIGVRKPHAEAFRAVLDQWPFPPNRVVMVGDSLYHDVTGAAGLGLHTIHFAAIENPFDEPYRATVRPERQVSSHAELLRVLFADEND